MKHPLSNLTSRAPRAALIAVLSLASSATLALAQTGQFIPLGDLFTGTNANFNSSANGIAIGGNTVVGQGSRDGKSGASVFEAFRWPGSGSIISIGDLSGGMTNAAALGVSGDGSTIVGFGHDNATLAQQKPFSWTSGGGFVTLGTLSGGNFGTARGISSNGNVIVGFSGGTGVGANGRAVSWTGGSTTPAILGTLPGVTTPNSKALGVSADGGVIVGWSDTTNGGGLFTEAFKWTSGTNMTGLGDLSGGSFFSQANGVSGDGNVIVGFGNSTNGPEAFRWTSGGGMQALGDLSGGIFNSAANAASGDGSVIVGSGDNGNTEAFIWTAALGMQSLSNVLTTIGVTNLAGWNLQEALAVSSDGLTIAGVGVNPNGGQEAWVATVPEPSTFGLAMVGACVLGYSVIRRRNQR